MSLSYLDDSNVFLPDIISGHAVRFAVKEAVVCGDVRVNWAQFNRAINRVAHSLLRTGHCKGGKVAVVMGNDIQTLTVMLGVIKAGLCVVPLGTGLTNEQLALQLRDCDAEAAFISGDARKRIESVRSDLGPIRTWVGVDFAGPGWARYGDFIDGASDHDPPVLIKAHDDCIISYSSGTTGRAKGILHSHRSRCSKGSILAAEMRFDDRSRALATTPLYSNGTLIMILPSLFVGGTLIILEQFSTLGALETIERERVTHTFMVPTQFLMMLDEPTLSQFDLSSLQAVLSAGSHLRSETRERIRARISPQLFELYGSTEGFATILKPDDPAAKSGSVGPATIGHSIRILGPRDESLGPGGVGEIAAHGSMLMKGYYNQPAETIAQIWRDGRGRPFFRSGDIGKMDEEGFVTLIDRKKDMIISGGFNLFPADLEQVLGGHEDVLDVAVIGVPHEKWGETPLALVILRPGRTPSAGDMLEWANARLARHQRLAVLEFRADFPRNALGKVLKRILREPYWRTDAADAADDDPKRPSGESYF